MSRNLKHTGHDEKQTPGKGNTGKSVAHVQNNTGTESRRTRMTIVYLDQWYPSSKTCNECGYKNEDLELKDRTWTCPKCNTTHDRDINAAKNIHQEGLKTLKEKHTNS